MTAWLAQTLIATSLLMAAVLILRSTVRRMFGAGAAYALWLVPALRLVLPPLDQSSPVLPTAGAIEIVGVAATAAPAEAIPWLIATWAAGAACFAIWHMSGYQRFLRRALNGAIPRGDGVFATAAVAGPAAIGLMVPRILIPLDFDDRFSPAERALAIAHERMHHARGDLWAIAAALAMLCLHWFNPLAWAAHRAFRSDQELSCDAAVIGRAGAEQRAVYAAAMVKSAWGAAPPFTCPMSRTGNLLRRLKMVKTHGSSRLARVGGMMTVGAVAMSGLMLTATNGIAAQATGEARTVVIKRLNGTGAATVAALTDVKARCGPGAIEGLEKELSEIKGEPVKVKVVDCGQTWSAGERLTRLQKARVNIAASSDVDGAIRGQILATLDAQIADLKAAD